VSGEELDRAQHIATIVSVQNRLNLVDLRSQDVFDACAAQEPRVPGVGAAGVGTAREAETRGGRGRTRPPGDRGTCRDRVDAAPCAGAAPDSRDQLDRAHHELLAATRLELGDEELSRLDDA
jgi:hypothetical protein